MNKFFPLWFLCSISWLAAQEVTIEQMLKTPFPTDLVNSSDGQALAFVMNSAGVRNIYVGRYPKFTPESITQFKEDKGSSLGQLAFSADQSKLIFVQGDGANRKGEFPNPTSDPDGMDQVIWMANVDGMEDPKPIVSGSNPSFHPNEEQIVYTRSGKAYQFGLSADAEEKPLFSIRGSVGELKYSPNGQYIAFTSNRGTHQFIGLYETATGELVYINPTVDMDGSIEWSPASNRLVFIRSARTRKRLPFFEQRVGLGWSIMLYDLTSKETRTLWTTPEGYGSVFRGINARNQLLWGADDHIIFPYEGEGWTQLYSLSIEEEDPLLLTAGNAEVQYVSLTTDRRTVLYSTNQRDIDRQHIWQIDVQGGTPVQVSITNGVEWSPISLKDNRVAALVSTGILPAQVAELVAGNAKPLFKDLLPAKFYEKHFVDPQQVLFTANDQLEIHGQLFKPMDFDPDRQYPAVLFFHGGSRRQMLLGYHHRGYYHHAFSLNQFLANQGYIVLSVNYRSGIGYGLEFREAENYGANGASEYNDVLAAADYLKTLDYVDPSKMGLWGGSYGGYLTALGLARNSDVFAAGVDIHGVHDWNKVINNFVPSYIEEHHPEIRKRAIESSPMHYIDSWKSPVLLIHGDDDRNVPFAETVDLVEELRIRDVYFEQLIFPDEVHGFLLHKNWVNAYKATVDFFDRMLKG